MATKNPGAPAADGSGSYEAALAAYGTAITQMHKGEFAAARDLFSALAGSFPDESELLERARMYSRVCGQRLSEVPTEPRSADEFFYRAVFLSNDGRPNEAIPLFDRALSEDPSSVKTLYARACAWALKGDVERAVSDLRSALTVDPTVRFQASNDPDFERVREEPSFIDVIEPTPTGH